jgi:hypothetical protein
MFERCLAIAIFVSLPSLIHGQSSMVGLPQDTAVLIRPGHSISMQGAQKHQQIAFQVGDAVWIGNAVAIPRTTPVIGEIVDFHRDWFRRIDGLFIKLLYICTASGERIPLHIVRQGKADWKIDLVAGAMPRDLETIAYVSRDVQLALAAPTALDHSGAAATVSLRPIVSR